MLDICCEEAAAGNERREVNETINPTAFIDFMIVVVVFLLHRNNEPFPKTCILQIDEGVSAQIVKSTFHTAVLAGYENVSFMVRKG